MEKFQGERLLLLLSLCASSTNPYDVDIKRERGYTINYIKYDVLTYIFSALLSFLSFSFLVQRSLISTQVYLNVIGKRLHASKYCNLPMPLNLISVHFSLHENEEMTDENEPNPRIKYCATKEKKDYEQEPAMT